MAQRERLGHLKFMQRARQRELAEAEAKAKRQEEAMSDDQWVAPVGFKSPRNKWYFTSISPTLVVVQVVYSCCLSSHFREPGCLSMLVWEWTASLMGCGGESRLFSRAYCFFICFSVVIIEGDPAPSTSIGRMSLQKFNPAFEVSAEHIGSSQESAGTSVKQPITVGEKSAVVRS